MKPKYEAVTREELRQRLGGQCSPMRDREGYVIGPDVKGRLCHCATCFSFSEAKRYAEKLNEMFPQHVEEGDSK